MITTANVTDRNGAIKMVNYYCDVTDNLSQIKKVLVDGGYTGQKFADEINKISSAEVEVVKRNGGKVSGPIPLPTEVEKITILRAVHKYKDSREQFEKRTHKRLIDIINPTKETIEALAHAEIPSGVDIRIIK